MNQQEDELPPRPLVLVLISDPFFWEKVEGTLLALEKQPLTPDWNEDLMEQLTGQPAVGAVVDLEDERFAPLEVLQRLRRDKQTRELTVLAYCSHLRRDLIDSALALGAEVVPRSTFAANLVRLLMELAGPADSAEQNKDDE